MVLNPLAPAELCLRIEPAALGFADTSVLVSEPLPWIGQERAAQAARFGLGMEPPDYNLFVLGESGSGRSTLLCQMMREVAATRAVPPDLCYLHNFEVPERPQALRMPAGQGRLLRQLMQQFAHTLQTEIPKRLAAQDVRAESEQLEQAYKTEEAHAYAALDAFAEARSFSLMREAGRLVFTLHDGQGRALTEAEAVALPKDRRQAIEQAEQELRVEIARFLDRMRPLERRMSEGLAALRRQRVKPLVEHELQEIRNELRKQIKDAVKLGGYFERVQHDVVEHVELFQHGPDGDDTARQEALAPVLARYRVNLVVDNHGLQGAPVIVEDNPLYRTLFGSIEYQTENDVLVTDFSRIRAGSLLRAHGGFLMLYLRDLLADEVMWEKLRRFLRGGHLQIEEPGAGGAPMASVSLLPQAVDVQVKLVLIGTVEEYYGVLEADPDFSRRFRCKVEFTPSFVANEATRRAAAIFVAHLCRKHGLPHFEAAAVARLLEDAHRQVDDQSRQSAVFAQTEALVLESAACCRGRGSALVQAQDVEAALRARSYRHDYPEQRLQESISDGERLIALTGERVGQVNGLTVVDLGDYRFGFPVRLSARTHAGEEGLIAIEREVELSGPIHDKGVLVLGSYLEALFAHIAPLALSASVVFEQEYGGVEGDSASCAELCVLLSCLSGLPLRQGVAVTGSLNQHGELLPVGGINEKIEGFFRSCERAGLDGQQGVLMPARNRRHLMLDARVMQAVAESRFHIWCAETVAEAMALLSGTEFGEGVGGRYPAASVLGRAQKTLLAYRKSCEASGLGKPQARKRAKREA